MLLFYRLVNKIFSLFPDLHDRCGKAIVQHQLKSVGTNFGINFPFEGYGLGNVTIGDNFQSGKRLKIRTFDQWQGETFHPQIRIGNNVCVQSDCHISAINSVTIEEGVLIASFVYISDHAHGNNAYTDLTVSPLSRPLFSRGGVHIGRNAWIGEKSSILPGVTIGEGAIIGANSVVTKDIPPYSIACGAPARVIKTINP